MRGRDVILFAWCLLLVVVAGAYLAAPLLPWTREEFADKGPAWVQAVGSVIAILVSGGVVYWQHHLERERLAEIALLDQLAALEVVHQVAVDVMQFFELLCTRRSDAYGGPRDHEVDAERAECLQLAELVRSLLAGRPPMGGGLHALMRMRVALSEALLWIGGAQRMDRVRAKLDPSGGYESFRQLADRMVSLQAQVGVELDQLQAAIRRAGAGGR